MGWFYHMGFSSTSYFLLFIFVWFIMWPFTHGNIIIFIEFVSQEHIIFGIACNQNDNGTLLDNLKLYHVLVKQVQLGSNITINYWKTLTWLVVQRIFWHIYFFHYHLCIWHAIIHFPSIDVYCVEEADSTTH